VNRPEAVDLVARVQGVWPEKWTPGRVEQWIDAIEELNERAADVALVRMRSSYEKCPSIAEFIATARPASQPRRDGHSLSCMCGGSGFVTVTQHDDRSSWEAFTRCPDGPPTMFIEPSDTYDPVAGEAAYATFDALAATAKSREELAAACFAAAAAYANTARRTLL
jgi:hypothetical protein